MNVETDLQICPMKESDCQEAAKLERNCFSQPWSQQSFLESLHQEQYLLLSAWYQKQFAGYVAAYQVLDEGFVVTTAVELSLRRQGVGAAMFQELFTELRRRGVQSLMLEVRTGNESAIRFYERLGFVTNGYRKHFYQQPVEDAKLMEIQWK